MTLNELIIVNTQSEVKGTCDILQTKTNLLLILYKLNSVVFNSRAFFSTELDFS